MKIEIPAFEPMAKCNEHLRHGPISIDLGDDVVKVVRCKDCKHCENYPPAPNGRVAHSCENGKTPWHTTEYAIFVEENDFCSYGEPKEAENGNG